jgi:protease-4
MKLKKIFWGICITLSVLSFLSIVSLYYSITRPPEVEPHSFLLLDVSGEVAEVSGPEFPLTLILGERLSFRDWMENIRKAGADERIDGIVLRMYPSSIGFAKVQELRRALAEFRERGKKVIAHIEMGGDAEYYLATAADRVYLQPVSSLFVDGFAARVTFLKGTFEKIGVEADFVQIGDYKNDPDQFMRKSMSEPHREVLTDLLESLFNQYVMDIAAARGKSPEDMKATIDRGYFTSRQALAEGLVDSLAYWDEVKKMIETDGESRMIAGEEYEEIEPTSVGLDKGPVIALIPVTGSIVPGSDDGSGEETYATSDNIRKAFEKAREDDDVRAVVLRINSPGGVATSSEVIWREAMLTRKEKPVVASMSDLAASGGYFIASACDAIVANPGTITGSIGVYAGKFDLSGLYEKIGLSQEMIKRGENAALFRETALFTEKERQKLTEDLWDFYLNDFVKKVAENRGLSADSVDALGRGRVWSGAQAYSTGLVDTLGTLSTAVAIAMEKAGIDPAEKVQLVLYPRARTFIERLFRIELKTRAGAELLPEFLRESYEDLAVWGRLAESGRFLAHMPYEIDIR